MDAAQLALESGGGSFNAASISTAGLSALAAAAVEEGKRLILLPTVETQGRNRGPVVDTILLGVDGNHRSRFCLTRYSTGNPCGWCKGSDGPTPQCFGVPWCALFALWCYQVAARGLGVPDVLASAGSDLAGHWKWLEFAQRTGRLVRAPAPGDVGLIFHVDDPHAGHVVIVAMVDGANVVTVEGNSAGNAAASRVRPMATITHFVRVA